MAVLGLPIVSRTLSWCLVAVRVVRLCRAVFATIRPIPGPADVSRCLCPDDVGGGGDESHENAGLGSELHFALPRRRG